MPPPRYPANPNVIKLTFDFDTLDKLKARAGERKVDTTRCAYELLQEALGVRPAPPATASPAPQPDDPFANAMRAGIAAINNRPRAMPRAQTHSEPEGDRRGERDR